MALYLQPLCFMKKQIIGVLGLCILGAGCSSSQKRFERIVPGMSESDVRKQMDTGPSRFEAINSQYTTWYWNNDFCVLFKDAKVVAKDNSESQRKVSVAGGGYEETRVPQCLAPGQTGTTATSRTINVPGIGKIELPKGQFREPSAE
jgi:hypothetical protein